MTLQEYKEKLMKSSTFKKEWERFDLWFEIQQKWLEFRSFLNQIRRNKTQ